jgi:hypothetical protein
LKLARKAFFSQSREGRKIAEYFIHKELAYHQHFRYQHARDSRKKCAIREPLFAPEWLINCNLPGKP